VELISIAANDCKASNLVLLLLLSMLFIFTPVSLLRFFIELIKALVLFLLFSMELLNLRKKKDFWVMLFISLLAEVVVLSLLLSIFLFTVFSNAP